MKRVHQEGAENISATELDICKEMAPEKATRRDNPQLKGSSPLFFSNGRGEVTKLSPTEAQVRIRYMVRTSMKCPCENTLCMKRVRLGRYGSSGDGGRRCPHCKSEKKDGFYFSGRADFERHLKSDKCQRARGLKMTKAESEKILGPQMCYEVSNPLFMKEQEKD